MATGERMITACRSLWEAVERYDEQACRRLGLGRTDLRALNILRHGPLSSREIGGRLGLTSGSVTALLERLHRVGLVTRDRAPHDRRLVLASLTSAAFEAFATVYGPLDGEAAGAVEELGTSDVEAAIGVLRAITAVFEAQAGSLGSDGLGP